MSSNDKGRVTKAWCGNCGNYATEELCEGEFRCENCGERVVTN